jgi:hypothetical protein
MRRRMQAEGLSPEGLSDQVGWNVREVLIDSEELWNFTLDGVRALCHFAGIPWYSLLPALETYTE